MDFFRKLFDTSDFPARWTCGNWTSGHGWLHILSDLGVWSAYFAIPLVLAYFVMRKSDLPFRKVFLLFVAFILFCGLTHLMDAVIFWWPAYRVSGLLKLSTAVVSWVTVFALVRAAPAALAMRSPEALEREIVARKEAERRLQETNDQLEQRVAERTKQLADSVVALGAERELLRTTLASIGDAVITTDIAGKVTDMNTVAEQLTAWPLAEAAGKPLEEVFPIVNEVTRQPVENPAFRALAEGIIVGLANHTILLAKDGIERPIDDSAAPIRQANGTIVGCVLVFRDVTERRATEAARERAAATLDSLTDGFWRLDRNWRMIYANSEACRLAGRSCEELLGKNIWEEFPLLLGTNVETQYRRVLAERVPIEFEHYFAEFDLWFGVKVTPMPDGGLAILTRDIGERKRTESDLQERTSQLDFTLAATGVGMWLNKLPLGKLNWDARTKELFLVPKGEEPTIDLFWSRLHPEDREPTKNAIETALKQGTLYAIDHRVIDPQSGTTRWLRSTGQATFDASGQAKRFDGINYDITDHKRLEDDLRKVAAELSEAGRKKDEFLATLAHELRNPLAPIRSGLQVMKLAPYDAESVGRARGMMERQLEQMVRLVDDLMDVSRITRGKVELKRQLLPLADVIGSAVEISRTLIDQMGHQLVVIQPEEQIVVDADPMRLAQIFANLLNNAAKYSDRGSRITLSAVRSGNQAVVSVKDTGIGIPVENLRSIFDMFSQVDRSLEKAQGGLGIGLTLVKRLVEMHGGVVEAHSDGPGFGSEFTVRLPLAVEESIPVMADHKGLAKPKVPLSILIVDDNRDGADSLAMMLRILGNETRVAYDGLQGVEAAEQLRPDVILFDIGLPKLNGYEACCRLRGEPWGKSITLIAVTGWGQDEDRQRSKEVGFDYHLVKPVDPHTLMTLLSSMSRDSQ